MIGVGGISTPEDGLAMLDAGASLIQLYTGLIYAGPGLVRDLNRAIAGQSGDGAPDASSVERSDDAPEDTANLGPRNPAASGTLEQ